MDFILEIFHYRFIVRLLLKRILIFLELRRFGLVNNFDELKLASDSIIPHVRTDIVNI